MQGDQRNIARTHIARARAQTHTHINNHYSRLYKEFFSLSFFFFCMERQGDILHVTVL